MRISKNAFTETKNQLSLKIGKPLAISVNTGRNNFVTFHGELKTLYPAVFTMLTNEDGLKTFSYADILSNNILFLPSSEQIIPKSVEN